MATTNDVSLPATACVQKWAAILLSKNPGRELPAGLLARLAKTDLTTARSAMAPVVSAGHCMARNRVRVVYWTNGEGEVM